MPQPVGLVLANACLGSDLQYCASGLYPHLDVSTVAYKGKKRNGRLEKVVPWQKSDWAGVRVLWLLQSAIEGGGWLEIER